MKRWTAAWGLVAGAALAVTAVAASGPAGAASPAVSTQLYVSAAAASDPACAAASQANPFHTIGAALACAHNGSTVHLGPGQFAGEVTVSANLTLIGAGAATVISDPTVPGDLSPELTIDAGRTVAVRNLHISGADNDGHAQHAGIRMGAGKLTVSGVAIDTTVSENGAGIDAEPGTGNLSVTVQNSTISNAFALQGGGAILVSTPTFGTASLNVLDSTITGNQANSAGGGIYLAGASLTTREATIAGNSASVGGGLFVSSDTEDTTTVTGTILAANTAFLVNSGPDCLATAGAGVNVVSGGHNLIGQDTGANATGCAGFTNTIKGDQVGTAASPINPVLGTLAANGGPTPTRALLSGSPAIGTGNAADCQAGPINDLDQRGHSRRADTRTTCDIGAYDTGGVSLQTLFVSASPASDPSCGTASQAHPFHTIAAALACARNGATIHIGAGQFAGEVTVAVNATLIGTGATTVIADPTVAADLVPELRVASGRTVTLRKLRINGADGATNPAHGGISSGAGTLTLDQVAVSGAIAQEGGGLDAESAAGQVNVTVQNSTISDNLSLHFGGGIAAIAHVGDGSSLSLINSTISDNQANSTGGGIYVASTSLTTRETTVAGNSASDGGGIYVNADTNHTTTVTGTLLAGNTAFDADSGPDCLATAGAGVNPISGGHNLIGQDTGANGTGCAGFTDNVNGDQVGTAANPINPALGPLAKHGGRTPTRALRTDSPAIGTGSVADCLAGPINDLDQRGRPRNVEARGACDVGAYDTGGSLAP